MDLHTFAPAELRALAEAAGATDVVVRTEELTASWFGWPVRTFEAAVLWRVRDGQNRIVAKGSTTASLGTSQQWGTFQFDVQLPASPPGTGDLFLEVYWASPKDGSDQGLVRVHLKVG